MTEGDQVEAQIKFGWEVDVYPVGEIADYVRDVSKGDIDTLVEEYYDKYEILLEGRDPGSLNGMSLFRPESEILPGTGIS